MKGRIFPVFSPATVFASALGLRGLELEENRHEVPLSVGGVWYSPSSFRKRDSG